jgi:branched-chain amino acid transport system permease protein
VVRRLTQGDVIPRLWPLLAVSLIVVATSLVVSLGSAVLDRIVITTLITLIVVVALYVFTGLSGVFSFGQIAFMAIGAYTAGLLTIDPVVKPFLLPELPSFLAEASLNATAATIVGGLVAAAVAAVLAVPLMRISGISASLATLGVLFIIWVVARQWIAVTNGSAGISGIPRTVTLWVALLWALVVMTVVYAFQQSRFGLRLRASREDIIAARSVGIPVGRERGFAFVLSAFFSGVAGGLYAAFYGGVSPDAFFLSLTFLTVVMLVIGGTASLAGAVVGTIVISALSEALRRIEQGVDLGPLHVDARPGLREVVLAVVMIAILIVRPNGITGGREIRWPFARTPRAPAVVAVAPPVARVESAPAAGDAGSERSIQASRE